MPTPTIRYSRIIWFAIGPYGGRSKIVLNPVRSEAGISERRRAGPTVVDVVTTVVTSMATATMAQGSTRRARAFIDDHTAAKKTTTETAAQSIAAREPDIHSPAMLTTNTRTAIAFAVSPEPESARLSVRGSCKARYATGPASAAHAPNALASSRVPVARASAAQNGVLRNPMSTVP